MPKDDKNPFASCSFTNLVFSFPQTEQIDFTRNLPFSVLIIFASLFPGGFFYNLHNKPACFYLVFDMIEKCLKK